MSIMPIKKNTSEFEQIPFALPDIGKEEIAQVTQCMESGWLTSGPKVKQFEQNFTDFIDKDVESISVSSATAGLTLGALAVGIIGGVTKVIGRSKCSVESPECNIN